MTTIIPIKPIGKVKLTPENKCGYCTNSTCCTYLTQHIDGPRSMEDFDMLLWQVSHRDMQLFKDDEGWFLLINNRCRQPRRTNSRNCRRNSRSSAVAVPGVNDSKSTLRSAACRN